MQLPNTDQLHTAICAGGATINPRTGEFVTSGGIVVALPGYEYQIRAKDFDRATLARYLARDDVKATIEHASGYMLGVWIDRQPRVYLDVVEVIADRPRALGLAVQRGERAVYDLDASQEIYV
jgi:hypothetical protein